MLFTDLEPHFIKLRRTLDPPAQWEFHYVDSLDQADGVIFLCPFHFQKNNGSEGTHSVICWFRGRNIPESLTPGPGRWHAYGEINSLTLSPSVNLGEGDWHGHITNGRVTTL